MKWTLTGGICILFLHLQAQTSLHHVREALALAEKNNPDYAAANAQPGLKKADKFMTGSAMMPQLTGFAAGDYNARLPVQPVPAEIFGGPAGTYKELRFGLPYNLNAGVDLSIPVIKANQWFELSAAKAEWKRSESEADQVAESIRLRTAQAYFSYMAATDAIQLNTQRLATTMEVSRIAGKKWEEGRIGEAEKIRAENLNRSAQMALNSAQLEAGNALRNLEQVLNSTGLNVDDHLDSYLADATSALPAVTERPSYIMNQLKMESLAQQSKARLADFFPSLALSGRYAYYFQANNPLKASASNVTYDQAIIGARINVPLFGGAKNYARLRQTKILLQIGELQMASEKIRLEKEHADISAEQHTVKENYRLCLQRQEAATLAESLSRKRYEEGIAPFTEYAESFYDLIQTQQECLQTAARLAYLNYVPYLLKSNSREK